VSDGPVLSIKGLTYAFGPRKALNGVSLEACAGEIYALLGPNGAGKTTLVRAVCGRIKPASGEVRICGRDPFEDGAARAALGLAPQALALYPQLTVAENLQTFARLAGLKGREAGTAVERAMTASGVLERAGDLVRRLSGGFQRRVNIAAAILARPRLLVLDEPTVGVDLPAREAISETLRGLKVEGVAILLVTHDLDHAQDLADRVGFLREGAKVLEGEPAALIEGAFGSRLEVEVDLGALKPGQEALLSAEGLAPSAPGAAWTCLAEGGYELAGRLAGRLKAHGLDVREVRARRPSLRQLFVRVAEQAEAPAREDAA
jgi:ABC-2 type transport system ATP-binding protein